MTAAIPPPPPPPPPTTEGDVVLGLRRFIHNVAVLLGVPPRRARGLLIRILHRLGADQC